jgi:ribonucleotide monophosphatase NagD (HAD superfamily)
LAAAIYLKETLSGGKIFLVGTPALEHEFKQSGLHMDDQAPDVVVLGFDTTLTYAKLWKLCDFVRAGTPYIATHPDFNCPTETGYMPDIGAMIAFVAASTGRQPDVVIGKPNRFMVEMASSVILRHEARIDQQTEAEAEHHPVFVVEVEALGKR